MKSLPNVVGVIIVALLAVGGWVILFHSDRLVHTQDDDDSSTKSEDVEVTVKVSKISRTTLYRNLDTFGTIIPAVSEQGHPGASIRVGSPTPGIISTVNFTEGSEVHKGDLLFELDNRMAVADVQKAQAALNTASAALVRLKASIRPEQIAVAEYSEVKAKQALDFAQRNYERQKLLMSGKTTSEKLVQESAFQVETAQQDYFMAKKQLELLHASPASEDVAEGAAKVLEAQRDLEHAQAQQNLLRVLAPIDATVVKCRVNSGEAIDSTLPVMELIDLKRLVVEVSIPIREAASLKIGQGATILPSYDEVARDSEEEEKGGEKTIIKENPKDSEKPNQSDNDGPKQKKIASKILGKVVFVGFQADRTTDTILVRISLPENSGFRPGQSARAKILMEEHENCLAVPSASVITNDDGEQVIVFVENGKAVLKKIKVGISENKITEIKDPQIHEGQLVVTEGAYGLPEGAKLLINEK